MSNEINVKAYTDSGATTSLIANIVIPASLKPKIRHFNGQVTNVNGNPVPNLGELKLIVHTPSQRIYENTLVFQKSKRAEHHLLLGMNVLQHALLDFALKKIRFPFTLQNQNTTRNYDAKDCVTIQLSE